MLKLAEIKDKIVVAAVTAALSSIGTVALANVRTQTQLQERGRLTQQRFEEHDKEMETLSKRLGELATKRELDQALESITKRIDDLRGDLRRGEH